MSDYSKITDFTAKDALVSGDPNKIVRGQLFQDEFDAISTSVNSKVEEADIIDPVIPPSPKIVIKNPSKATRDIDGSTYSTLEPQFYTIEITPNLSSSKIRLTWLLDVFADGSRVNNNTSGLQLKFKVVGRNRQTGQTATIAEDYTFETSLRGGTGYFVTADAQIPVAVDVLTGSINMVLGDSTSGYEFEIQSKSDLTFKDIIARADSCAIAEEIPL